MAVAQAADTGSLPVLATKLFVPPHRDDVIARPRLTDRLTAGLPGKLTLISAPPGFGKTTLVTEWLAVRDIRRVGWLGLDPGDNDPGRFLTYVIGAIRTVEPDFGPGLINLLQTVTVDPSIALVDLINALSNLSEPVVLVLDDYHVITDEGVHRAVAYIIDHQPASLHLIVTSRSGMPISLSLLRTRRELTELRADDLRFTIDEATDFLTSVMGLDLRPEQIAALDRRAEGWIVGLLLAALAAEDSAQPDAPFESFGGEHRYIFDYLAEEVLRRQTPEVRDFLERTSVLGRICADLASALGATNCQDMLDYLIDANLFTTPLDARREWYRYHHLFGEFLAARYREQNPAGWEYAHALAGEWFYAHGHYAEAVEHALASGDRERLIGMIEAVGLDHVRYGQISTLARWLAALPDEVISERPALALLRVWTVLLGRRLDEAALWLERVDLTGVSDPARLARLKISQAVCRATLARFRGNIDEIVREASAALDLFETLSKPLDRTAAVALLHLGSALRARGDTSRSIEVLAQAVDLATAQGGHVAELNGKSQLAAAWAELGDVERAEKWARDALERERDYGLRRLGMCEMARITLAVGLREREEFDAALAYLDDSLSTDAVTSDANELAERISALHERALVYVALGDADVAIESIEEAVRHARDLKSRPAAAGWAEAMRARVQLLLGRSEPAIEWAGGVDLPPGDPIGYQHEQAALTLAWVDIERGRLDEAGQLLTRLIDELEEAGRQYRLAEARLLLAVVCQRQDMQAEAHELVDLAIEWAGRRHFRRILLDTHPEVRALLADAQRRARRAGREWLEFLEAVTGAAQGPAGDGGQAGLAEPLSERELEVLALLKEGITNREIAERLFLSVGTVKRHTHNIYSKLEVNSRTQAIVRGQELNLIH